VIQKVPPKAIFIVEVVLAFSLVDGAPIKLAPTAR